MKKQGKKILIGVLITLLIGGLIIVFVLNYHSQSSTTNEMNLVSTNSDDNILKDNEDSELANEQNEENLETVNQDSITEKQEDNFIKQEESTIINEEKTNSNNVNASDKVHITNKTIQEQVKDNEPQKNSNNNQTLEQTNAPSKNNTPNISQNENKETNIKQEEKNEETTQEKQEDKEVITPTISEEPKVEEETKEEIQEEPQKENIHSYKYNSTITEQIKQDILNNESDYMKQYGYTIVIDESIVTLTNQFTYTSTRVKDKIIKKFGTIRIYARDYYYNGEYMFTECYII